MLIKIPNRCFITLSGNDVKSFLQGITTIDIDKINSEQGGWGAVLSPQGKFQYGFFIFEYKNTLYIETNEDNLMDLGKHLTKFAVNIDVVFAINKNITVYADLSETNNKNNVTIKNDILTMNDPRHNVMGKRIYGLLNQELDAITDNYQYEKIRIKNTVVDLDTDGIFNNSYPLELNMDKLNGVNFDKGCFIGQEVTARMHYRNSVKKNAYTIEANQKLQSQNEITNSSGRVIATLTSAIDNIGIAIIRNQHINEDLYIGKNKINILKK